MKVIQKVRKIEDTHQIVQAISSPFVQKSPRFRGCLEFFESLRQTRCYDQELFTDNGVVKRMKLAGVIILCLLAACAAKPTMEELEAEASITGDWSAVEKREKMNRRMGVQDERQCEPGYMLMCNKRSAQEICSCVRPSDRAIF